MEEGIEPWRQQAAATGVVVARATLGGQGPLSHSLITDEIKWGKILPTPASVEVTSIAWGLPLVAGEAAYEWH